jgi:hypothetical protein
VAVILHNGIGRPQKGNGLLSFFLSFFLSFLIFLLIEWKKERKLRFFFVECVKEKREKEDKTNRNGNAGE